MPHTVHPVADRNPLRNRIVRALALMVALFSLVSAGAALGDCIEYSDYLHPVGSIAAPSAMEAALAGNYLFLAGNGLRVIDVSDPAAPHLVATLGLAGTTGVAVSGDRAYVVAGHEFHVIDISTPLAPVLLTTFSISGYGWGVAVDGDFAYVTAAYQGLYVIDITNPSNPHLEGSVDTDGDLRGIAKAGPYVYCTALDVGLVTVSVGAPASPVQTGLCWTGMMTTGITIVGQRAFVASSEGIAEVSLADPSSPTVAAMLNEGYLGYGLFALSGDRILAAGGFTDAYANYGHLAVLDVAVPGAMHVIGRTPLMTRGNNVVAAGARAYVSEYDYGLQVVDCTVLESAPILSFLETPPLVDVVLDGTIAYLGLESNMIWAVDVSDPSHPSLLGSYYTALAIKGMAAFTRMGGDRYLCVAHGSTGIRIYRVTNPAAMTQVGSLDTPGWAANVTVQGNQAYVADGWGGLRIVDLTSPSSPALLGAATSNNANDVVVAGSYAYVADGTAGLIVVNVTDPLAPAIVGQRAVSGVPVSVDVQGDHAFVLTSANGISCLSVTNPALPTIESVCPLNEGFEEVRAGEGSAYTASSQDGLYVVGITNPEQLQVNGMDLIPHARAVAVNNAMVCLATQDGLTILPTQCAHTGGVAADVRPEAGIGVWPNPARSGALIRFALPGTGKVRLEIHDVGGRLIRRLLDGPAPADGIVSWDSRDDQGRLVPGGVYLLRFGGEGTARTGRVVID